MAGNENKRLECKCCDRVSLVSYCTKEGYVDLCAHCVGFEEYVGIMDTINKYKALTTEQRGDLLNQRARVC